MKPNFSIIVAGALLFMSIVDAQALQPRRDGQGVSNPGGIHKCRVIGQQCSYHGGGSGQRCHPVYSCS